MGKRRPLFPALHRARRLGSGATSSRVAVVARVPWPVRVLILMLVLALGAALGSGLYEYARRVTGLAPAISASELGQLRDELQRLAADNERLQNLLSAADGRIAIERAAKDQLAAEFRAAQKEAGDLRNDLAFFEQLIPADPRLTQVAIRSAELEKQGDVLRYRVLLMRAGRPSGEFKGQLQFTASGTRGGGSATIDLRPYVVATDTAVAGADGPVANGAAAMSGGSQAAQPGPDPLGLRFRQYQRAEGMLELPRGFVARTVTVRVLEGGVVRSQSIVNLPA